jgi:hypothetical protein
MLSTTGMSAKLADLAGVRAMVPVATMGEVHARPLSFAVTW